MMKGNHMIITICGSARFRDEIDNAQKKLTLEGHLIFTVEDLRDVRITKEIEAMLDESHRKKIDLSDAIYVVNVDGYVGPSTSNEIAYAKSKGKQVFYLETK